jgi:hypothetical protein
MIKPPTTGIKIMPTAAQPVTSTERGHELVRDAEAVIVEEIGEEADQSLEHECHDGTQGPHRNCERAKPD